MVVDQVLEVFTATASRPSRCGPPPHGQAEGFENSNTAPKAFLSDIRRGGASNFSKEKPCKRGCNNFKEQPFYFNITTTNTYIKIK